jgi:hypothetical protein
MGLPGTRQIITTPSIEFGEAELRTNPLVVAEPPWMVMADLTSTKFTLMISEFRDSGGKEIAIDGANATTTIDLFHEFARAADFPRYFGFNWPAFDECLADLEWLPAEAYVVTVRNPDQLLNLEPLDRDVFLRILTKVAAEWAGSVNCGEDWDRPATPFHVVFDQPTLTSDRSGTIASIEGGWAGRKLQAI